MNAAGEAGRKRRCNEKNSHETTVEAMRAAHFERAQGYKGMDWSEQAKRRLTALSRSGFQIADATLASGVKIRRAIEVEYEAGPDKLH